MKTYEVSNGHDTWLVPAGSAAEALQAAAQEEAAEVAALDLHETAWVSLTATGGGETERLVVQVDPPEPPCPHGEHEWVQADAVLHGGGFIRHDRCSACGVGRRTDTWSNQDGRVSVRYEEEA